MQMRHSSANQHKLLRSLRDQVGQSDSDQCPQSAKASKCPSTRKRHQANKRRNWKWFLCAISWALLANCRLEDAASEFSQSSSQVTADGDSPKSQQSWQDFCENQATRAGLAGCTAALAKTCTGCTEESAIKTYGGQSFSSGCLTRVSHPETRAAGTVHFGPTIPNADKPECSHISHDAFICWLSGCECFRFAELRRRAIARCTYGNRTSIRRFRSGFCAACVDRTSHATSHADARSRRNSVCTDAATTCISAGTIRSHFPATHGSYTHAMHDAATECASTSGFRIASPIQRPGHATRQLGRTRCFVSESFVQRSWNSASNQDRRRATGTMDLQPKSSTYQQPSCRFCPTSCSGVTGATRGQQFTRWPCHVRRIPAHDRSVYTATKPVSTTNGTTAEDDASKRIEDTAISTESHAAIWSGSEKHSETRSNLSVQYPRTYFPSQKGCCSALPDDQTTRTRTQDPQSCAWQCIRPARYQHSPSSSPIVPRRLTKVTYAYPNGNCRVGMGWPWPSCGERRLGVIGVAIGTGCAGPCSPPAEDTWTTEVGIQPQAPVVLSLDDLLPLQPQDKLLKETRDLWDVLCQPWPDHSFLHQMDFVDFLPDLAPQFRKVLTQIPVWQGEPVKKISIYVDGSSFAARTNPNESSAAWAFALVFECDDPDQPFRFGGTSCSPLSRANEYSTECLGIGELLHDALTAEAVGMVWVLSWILQTDHTCPVEVCYDNNTIGRFMSGSARWNCTWEYTKLHRVLSALRSCFHVTGRRITFQHVKAHAGCPWNEMP